MKNGGLIPPNKKKWYVGMPCRIETKTNHPASCFKEVG